MGTTLTSAICLYMVVYYGIVLYTMFKFYKNSCRCKKMEAYKKTWNYYYIIIYSMIAVIFGMQTIYSTIQKGGSMCNSWIIVLLLLILQAPAYLNDYAILSLFGRMKREGCPCTTYWRDLVEKLTYARIAISFLVIHKRCVNFMEIRKIRKRNFIRK